MWESSNIPFYQNLQNQVMLLIIKIIEFIFLFIILGKIIQLVNPGKPKKKTTVIYSSTKSKRFDGTGSDISDADYEEIH